MPYAPCLLGDDVTDGWHQMSLDAGQACCLRCRDHHRHPETCPGILEDGTDAPYPHHDDPLP